MEAGKELIWMRDFLSELGMKQEKFLLHCDNQSVIHLAKKVAYHSRTKHIQRRYLANGRVYCVRLSLLMGDLAKRPKSTERPNGSRLAETGREAEMSRVAEIGREAET